MGRGGRGGQARVNRFSGALSLELQHAPERHHFAVGRAELLVQVETLTLGGEQPRQDVSNLRKIVVSGTSGKLCGLGQERDARLAMRAMGSPLSPGGRMAVRVP